MRRSVLLTLAVLGVLVSVVGGVGLFAALTDSGTTGTITVESGALPGSADLKMTKGHAVDNNADGIPDQITCDEPYSDNLATDPSTVSVSPGFTTDKLYVCIENVGSQNVSLALDAVELTDVELDCTGDEALVENDCGIVAGTAGVGELSGVLAIHVNRYPTCDPTFSEPMPAADGTNASVLGSLASTPLALHGLGAGIGNCYSLSLSYPGGPPNTPTMIQAAQSDQVTWRFRFSAAA